jgi:PKD repeat protein
MRFSFRLFISLWLVFFIGACTQEVNTGTSSTTGSTGPATTTSNPKNPAYTPPSNTGDTAGGGSTSTGSNKSNGKDSLTIAYTVNYNCVDSNITVTFTATYSRTVKNATYEFYFGDGNSIPTTSLSTVYNTYALKGTYTVIAKIDSAGGNIASATKTITLSGTSTKPVASFTSNTTNTAGNGYAFNGSQSTVPSGTITNYSWDFGDGNGNFTNSYYVTHTYTQQSTAQTYNVTLTVKSSGGCSNYLTKQVAVPAGSTAVTGGFTYSSTNPCSANGEVFTFVSGVTNLPASPVFNWNFGDGTTGTGSTVTKQYSLGGTYTVTLTITGNGTSTVVYSSSQTITAYGQNVTPTAGFTFTKSSSNSYIVTFSSTSTVPNGTLTYQWNFGDGTTANTSSSTFQKTYTVSGTYSVTLTATSNAGCSATTTAQSVTVP